MNVKLLVIFLLFPFAANAQGFSNLGAGVDGFATPIPDTTFDFPIDHGPHPDYRIEWWYITANLQGPDSTRYGLQWTLFRTALAPGEAVGWQSPQVWFAHAAVTTPERHFATERFARGGIGQAGVQTQPFYAWIDEWALRGDDLDTLALSATGTDFGYDMALKAQGPLVLHGANGFSTKSAKGQASYYYSQPFYDIQGTLTLPSGKVSVTGSAWLDREWSSQLLADDQNGWDWFSLSFTDGAKLMGFQLREDGGSRYSSSTWIATDGTTTAYGDGVFTAEPLATHTVAGRDVPTQWRVTLPDRDLNVVVDALNPNAWMPLSTPYWEGPVGITGSHTGNGYLEMTGYE